MQQVANWLKSLGLGEYVQRFAENHIDASVLSDLTDQDLEKIGIHGKEVGEILRRLLDAVIADPRKNTHEQLLELARDFKARGSN